MVTCTSRGHGQTTFLHPSRLLSRFLSLFLTRLISACEVIYFNLETHLSLSLYISPGLTVSHGFCVPG